MKLAALAILVLIVVAAPRPAQPVIPADRPALRGATPMSSGNLAERTEALPLPAVASGAASERPSGRTTPMPAPLDAVTRQGTISHMGPGYSRTYLALPCKRRGVHCRLLVELCGPSACVVLRQTDYGPSQRIHPNRIADVSPAMFERICGVPASFGLCPGSWTAISLPSLPPTSTGGGTR